MLFDAGQSIGQLIAVLPRARRVLVSVRLIDNGSGTEVVATEGQRVEEPAATGSRRMCTRMTDWRS